ncbi:hypothetical protein KIN20_013022 [Parelaphostrongylus tenuis]|uniref:Uncharacterized protein n=1 Tax=Parelaphostrongylus tenuis TaxID=148309 RepID=A0AAD5MEY4_PARTN|nr:hypothetical protein KIN20_013022 [Parelaphostrongylus tenuis]
MLVAVRSRLTDISLTTFETVETPTAEKISIMKLDEQRDAYIAGYAMHDQDFLSFVCCLASTDTDHIYDDKQLTVESLRRKKIAISNGCDTAGAPQHRFKGSSTLLNENLNDNVRAGRVTFGVAESDKLFSKASSMLPDQTYSESKKYVDDEERTAQSMKNTEIKPLADAERNATDNEKRMITFAKDEAPKLEAETVPDTRSAPPPASTQQSSAYQKMIGLFGRTNTSDTDDDAVGPTRSTITHENSRPTSIPKESTAEQGSAGMLAQYLSTKTKPSEVTTSSDSDDDFFK